MTAKKGYFTFILHSHLPYVISHGRWPHGMDWLNEAVVECYLPLLSTLNKLVDEGLSPNIVIGITPVLMEQLRSSVFKDEMQDYIETKIRASEADIQEFTRHGNTGRAKVAGMWKSFFSGALDDLENRYNWDILGAFIDLQNKGAIEIITCAATHGYLPLLGKDECVSAQIRTGKETYRKHCGRDPLGIWLPECAYRPSYEWKTPVPSSIPKALRKGVEEYLYENGIKYFIVDSPLLDGSKPVGVYLDRFEGLKKLWEQSETADTSRDLEAKRSPYDVYYVSSTGRQKPAAIFVRDPETAIQVWSGEHGYPGDGNYLDFHKKHYPGGNRYWRVTAAKSDLADKKEYDPDAVEARLRENASHFCSTVRSTLASKCEELGKPAVLVAPFDTELFGHWWFEGPRWLYHVLKELSGDGEVELMKGSGILEEHPPDQVISIPEGSWGEGGFHWIWLNPKTEWTWRHIYDAEKQFIDFITTNEAAIGNTPDLLRVIKQAARELLLLESSDWQFLISTWSARDYAELRLAAHYEAFKRLLRIAEVLVKEGKASDGDWLYVIDREQQDDLFKDVDIGWWKK